MSQVTDSDRAAAREAQAGPVFEPALLGKHNTFRTQAQENARVAALNEAAKDPEFWAARRATVRAVREANQ